MGGSFKAAGEDIWAGGEDIRGSEDIWVAVLRPKVRISGLEVRISGVVRIFGWQFEGRR